MQRYPRVFYILLLQGVLTMFGGGMINPFLPLFAQSLGATGVFIGIVVASFFISRVFFELPSGYLSDRIGRRTPIISSVAITLAATTVTGLARDPYQLALGRGLWGLGSSLFFLTSSLLIIDIFDVRVRGRALGTLQGIEWTGSFLGAFAGGFAVELLGYNTPFLLYSLILLPLLVFTYFSRDLKEYAAPRRENNPDKVPLIESSRRAAVDRSLQIIYCIAFFQFILENGVIGAIVPIYFKEYLSIDEVRIGILLSSRSLGYIFTTLLAGFFSDRVGRKPVLFAGLVLDASAMLSFIYLNSFYQLLPLMALTGAAGGTVMVMLPILTAEVSDPSVRGTAMGLYRTSFDTGAVVGPILMTAILSYFDIWKCFTVGALSIAATIPFTRRIRPRSQ
jgi:MFS family permease